jgi:hypothetical protein
MPMDGWMDGWMDGLSCRWVDDLLEELEGDSGGGASERWCGWVKFAGGRGGLVG